jgi:hypothetical protein
MCMSCCGEAKDQPVTNRQPLGAGPGIIENQPTYQTVLNGFQPPIVHDPFSSGPVREFRATSPSQQSAAHTFTGTAYNGQSPFQQPTFTGTTYNNGQLPMREFGASSPSHQQTALPTFTGTTYNGSNFNSMNQSITRPKSSHTAHSPPQVNAPSQDEGKMSISIDFGVYPHVASLYSLIPVQAQHFLVL